MLQHLACLGQRRKSCEDCMVSTCVSVPYKEQSAVRDVKWHEIFKVSAPADEERLKPLRSRVADGPDLETGWMNE